MARQPRTLLPDGMFHAFAGSVAEASLFREDEDRRYFLGVLAGVVRAFDWQVQTFCLLGTHYHLLV
jgi:putative transposase